MRHIYTLLSAALAVFTAVAPAEAPRQVSVDTVPGPGASPLPPASSADSISIGGSSTPGAVFYDYPLAIAIPAGVWTPSVERWCCLSDFGSPSAISSWSPPSIFSLANDGDAGIYTLVRGAGGTTPWETLNSHAWSNAGTSVQLPGANGGLSGASVPAALTLAGSGPGTLNSGPALTPAPSESVPEPTAFLLLLSGVVGLGLWRRQWSRC